MRKDRSYGLFRRVDSSSVVMAAMPEECSSPFAVIGIDHLSGKAQAEGFQCRYLFLGFAEGGISPAAE